MLNRTFSLRNGAAREQNGKKILQFWSGGADSTYLLLQNLMADNQLSLAYVNIVNNRDKLRREDEARKLLKSDIDKFCDYFGCNKPIYIPDHMISVKGDSFGECPAPQQIIFAMFSLLTGEGYDEIHMGVVLGDSMQGSYLNEDFRKAFIHNLRCGLPEIRYPIEEVSKEAIYLTLRGYDEVVGTSFLKHITCCEKVDTPCGEEKECLPCITQSKVFKRLKWV